MNIHKLFSCLAAIGLCFGTLTSLNADSLYVKSSSGETYEYPPLPPVFVNGVQTSWEEAYGSLPFLSLPDGSLVSASKNPSRSGELPPTPPGVVTPASDTNTVNFQINWEQIRYNINTNLSGSILTNNPPLDSVITNRMLRLHSLNSNLQANLYYPPKVDILDLEKKAIERREILEYAPELNVPVNLNLYLVGKETHSWGTSYVLWVEGLPNDYIFSDEQDVEFFAATDLASGDWKLVNFNITARTISDNIKEYIVYLNDDPESIYFTVFPLRDTDGDYLSDGVEKLIFKSDPGTYDTNNNPNNDPADDSGFLRDSNGNGIPDYPNKANNWICDGDEDLDGDGFSNAEELARGTDPFVPETTAPSDFENNNDFLPLWAKRLIYIYTGVENPTLSSDSDNDGANDYTEIGLGTDPSKADFYYSEQASYNQFISCPNNIFTSVNILVHDVSTNNLFSNGLFFNVHGIIGSHLQLEVRKNVLLTNNISYDQINVRGGYLYPPNWVTCDLTSPYNGLTITNNNSTYSLNSVTNITVLREALKSSVNLLGKTTAVGKTFWDEPGVSVALEDISAEAAYIISNRSLGRISILMKQMQTLAPSLMENFQDESPAMQRKICRWVSNMLSEAELYNRSVNRYSYPVGALPISHINRLMRVTSAFCMFFNIFDSQLLGNVESAGNEYISNLIKVDDGFWEIICRNFASALANYIINIQPTYPTDLWSKIEDILIIYGIATH